MWFDHRSFVGMMNEFWEENGNINGRWSDKLRRCKEKLKSWNQSSFGNVQKRIKSLKKELEEVRMQERNQVTVEREHRIVESWIGGCVHHRRYEYGIVERNLGRGDQESNFSLGPLKAPGIDGFPAVFYQKFWEKVKASVVSKVRRFWMDGFLDKEMNKTLITLIPKKKDADRMEDWRPISLCTVAVKIITKILAMRLQPILDKNRRNDKNFYASIKVDMSKAFDRVEWSFLERLLLKLSFADKWVARVMLCVSTVSYQKLLNVKLQKAVLRQRISGIQICKKAPIITHLLFADDSIFFIKAKKEEVRSLKAGREVLVKAVIQAIPVYMMSVYQFPKRVISNLSKLIQQFWWAKNGNKGISWLSQNILQRKKCEGGLIFKDLSVFNEAILMKIAWRIVKYPQLLMSQVLSAKYCKGRNILHAKLGASPSHIRRGIMRNIHTFLRGIWWEEDGVTCRWRHSGDGVFSVKSAYEVIKAS
ncbi:hypothetical protein QQ045_024399 [Rhodiola kirilowii]